MLEFMLQALLQLRKLGFHVLPLLRSANGARHAMGLVCLKVNGKTRRA
jgi:hypothetical protein